jgi:hypothetical protein
MGLLVGVLGDDCYHSHDGDKRHCGDDRPDPALDVGTLGLGWFW